MFAKVVVAAAAWKPRFSGLGKKMMVSPFFVPQAPKRIELKVGNLENLDLLNRWCLIFPVEN